MPSLDVSIGSVGSGTDIVAVFGWPKRREMLHTPRSCPLLDATDTTCEVEIGRQLVQRTTCRCAFMIRQVRLVMHSEEFGWSLWISNCRRNDALSACGLSAYHSLHSIGCGALHVLRFRLSGRNGASCLQPRQAGFIHSTTTNRPSGSTTE